MNARLAVRAACAARGSPESRDGHGGGGSWSAASLPPAVPERGGCHRERPRAAMRPGTAPSTCVPPISPNVCGADDETVSCNLFKFSLVHRVCSYLASSYLAKIAARTLILRLFRTLFFWIYNNYMICTEQLSCEKSLSCDISRRKFAR